MATGKKTGGRKAGTPNKVQANVRALFQNLVENKVEDFEKAFDAIEDPAKKAKIYLDLCKFVVPSLQSVSISAETKEEKTIEEKLKELSEEMEG